jgi:hypothetical protein
MVETAIKGRLLEALGFLLEPVVLLLLKNGVTWAEFSEIARERFVDVATRRFGLRGRPTNISRVAILTGLDRREVSRLRHRRDAPSEPRAICKPTQVLDGWFRDPEFLDDAGRPRELAIDGRQHAFEALVRRYAPSIPHVAMLKQLRSVGAVEDAATGGVRVLKRAYVPRALSEDHIALWGSVLHDIGATWEHNLMREPTQRSRFERRAVNLKVDAASMPAFQAFLESEGQAFLERVDDWLSAHEVPGDDPTAPGGVRLGVGVYHIGDDKLAPRRER